MKRKPLYSAKVEVWAASLNRKPMVEDVWVEITPVNAGPDGQKRTERRQRLGLPLDGGKGRQTPASRRPGFYVSPAGIGHDMQGVEIKDREAGKGEGHARIWSSK